MRVLLFPNLKKTESTEIIHSVIEVLQKDNCDIFLLDDVKKYADNDKIKIISTENIKDNIDIAITIGGDGTIIRAANLLLEYEIPIIGINLGTLGFLTGIEKNELHLIHKIVQGEYGVDERLVLEVIIENNNEKTSFTAINDVVICKNAFSGVIDINVVCGSTETAKYRGDGVILSTTSGSTAYAMSAGGPIIHPSVKAISLTPICAHSLLSRTIVLPENEIITIKTNADLKKRSVCVVADGLSSKEITENDKVTVKQYRKNIKFISLEGKNYYSAINQKLMER